MNAWLALPCLTRRSMKKPWLMIKKDGEQSEAELISPTQIQYNERKMSEIK